MSLSIQAVGSYFRHNAPTPKIIAEYRLSLAVKVLDQNGEPVSGLTAENFVVRAAGFDENILPAFTVNESPSPAEFPGFYHLKGLYSPPTSPFLSLDIFLLTGLIVALKVTHAEESGSSLVALTPCVASTDR